MLTVGFAARCITPPPGKEIPGLFERRFARGIHDDLFARSVVIDDEVSCVAFVQVDAIVVPETLVAAARREAQRMCGIPGTNCFIAATHTHSGGPICSMLTTAEDPEYQNFVAQQIAASVSEGFRLRQSAFLGIESEQAHGVAFNRRFLMRDGSQITHPGKMNPDALAPAGPEDPRVTVFSFFDPESWKPSGCIVNFACHATHINGLYYSADYVKWIIDTLKSVYGPDFGVVFLNGACGDVTQVDNRSPRPIEMGVHWAERSGRIVAGAALQAIARATPYNDASIGLRRGVVRAALRKISPQALQEARKLLAKHPVTPRDVDTIFAKELLEVAKLRRKMSSRPLEIFAVRIADAALWGVPGELFQSFALIVRDQSPFLHTCCVELANGYNGYICTPEAFEGGGYEVLTARTSMLEPTVGSAVVKMASRLLADLFKQAKPELEQLPQRRVWPTGDASALEGLQQLASKNQPRNE